MDYANGKIYQIRNTEDDEVYVGSTCTTLTKRFSNHKSDSNRMKKTNCHVYKHMNALGVEKFYIELIEDFPCENKTQLTAREGVFIRDRGTLNMLIAGRTPKEYYQNNKVIIAKKSKVKYDEQIKDAEYRDHRNNLQTARRELNPEKQREINAMYGRHDKCECECGGKFTRHHKSTHEKSKKHQDFVVASSTPSIT